jgi:DNA-binding NtrC family response regulator
MALPLVAARSSGECHSEGDPSAAERGLVLVVDDMEEVSRLVAAVLVRGGYEVQTFASGEACLQAMSGLMPEAIYLDLEMPGLGGLQTLARLRERHPAVPVVMLTGDERVESVVSAMKLGAYDYLAKPPERQKLLAVARNAVLHHRMSRELTTLKREAGKGNGYQGIVTQAESMKEVFRQMDRVAGTDITLLLQGESGTGKELVARAIHAHSARRSGPFVAVNCAAIPDTLHESELFGHEKGAFTGAIVRRLGRFELADKGTLFLDEVGELSLSAQAKLLRVLQDNTFHRVGGSQEIRSDFRLVAATFKDLAREVREGRFREDLYYRIVVFELELPPLRARRGDLDVLLSHFLRRYQRPGEESVAISPEARVALEEYSWPGNVRELENVIHRAVVSTDSGVIEPGHLPLRLRQASAQPARPSLPQEMARGETTPEAQRAGDDATLELRRLEEIAIRHALRKTGGNLVESGRLLGVSRATLYRKLKKYRVR